MDKLDAHCRLEAERILAEQAKRRGQEIHMPALEQPIFAENNIDAHESWELKFSGDGLVMQRVDGH